MKILNGKELAGFIKERQAQTVRSLSAQGVHPRLAILRDNDHPVIAKYVALKQKYGEDIGVKVDDVMVPSEKLKDEITRLNRDAAVSGMIVQLPLKNPEQTDEIVQKIAPEKDVDGLSSKGRFDSATATAINWLLTGYDIDLKVAKIALVGRGRLVGGPLAKMWRASGLDVTVYGHDGDLSELVKYDVIVSATGVAGLIKSEYVSPGAVLVDAGTASEGGKLVGDAAPELLAREDLKAITPRIGGVGPLTVSVLFDNTINATIFRADRV